MRMRGLMKAPNTWATELITQLLQISHAQWIYRCAVVHDKVRGTLVNQHKWALEEEIAIQLALGTDTLLKEDKYLLE